MPLHAAGDPLPCHREPSSVPPCPSSTFEGAPAVSFSEAVVDALAAPFRFALVKNFSHDRPPIEAVRKVFGAFRLNGPISVGVISPKLLMLHPSSEADFLRLRSKDVWFVANAPTRVFRWSPDFSADRESPIAPIWVAFPGLPQHLFAKPAMFSIAACIGTPLQIDKVTEIHSRPSRACIQVEMDTSIPLPSKLRAIAFGNSIWQPIEYEHVPKYCSECFHRGYSSSSCKRASRAVDSSAIADINPGIANATNTSTSAS
ncbi:uncharacterized protein M6B38_129030 [Iris pallida]|uniref:DUF4283 domain-containing protein n=1 Tax=Iris pallida TaxID=29817 RepID=A0AAX6G642_IRIPA|nr:uncharacterized protein M6B38_129030 [Iris pallida]